MSKRIEHRAGARIPGEKGAMVVHDGASPVVTFYVGSDSTGWQSYHFASAEELAQWLVMAYRAGLESFDKQTFRDAYLKHWDSTREKKQGMKTVRRP